MEPIRYELDGVTYTLHSIGADTLSPHDTHTLRVYNDPDFIDDLVKLKKLHDSDITRAIIDSGSTASKEVHAFFKDIATDWRITTSEVSNIYMNSQEIASKRLVREPDGQPMLVDWVALLNTNRFTVDFNLLKLRKSDLEELWKIVETRKSELDSGRHKRNRNPENESLIYAIFKARKNGDTFPKIYRDYINGTLANYSGSTGLNSADSLSRHYRKYMP